MLSHLRKSLGSSTQRAFAQRSFVSTPQATIDAALRYPETEVTVLDNGLRVASEKRPGQSATVGLWVDTGSRYETAENNGVAHFAEHLFFKGTEKRTRQALELEIEQMGGHLNAYTSREQTTFYYRCMKNDLPKAMDILSDIMLNSQVTKAAVDAERNTIISEFESVNSDLKEVVFDRLHESAYRGTALGRTILGPVENIQKITREDILEYLATHYTAPRMVIAGCGDFEHAELVKLASDMFGSVPVSPSNGVEPYLQPAKFTGSDIRIRFDDLDEANIAYAFPTAGYADPDTYPLMVIQTMFGSMDKNTKAMGNSSSPLIRECSELDCATSIVPFNTQYSDTGLFGIQATGHPIGLDNLGFQMTRAFTRLCYNVDENLMNEAKNSVKANLLNQIMNSTESSCEEIGRQMLSFNRRLHPTEVLARIDAVDANAIRACANRYFYDMDPVVASIGPLYEFPDYNQLRMWTYLHRM